MGDLSVVQMLDSPNETIDGWEHGTLDMTTTGRDIMASPTSVSATVAPSVTATFAPPTNICATCAFNYNSCGAPLPSVTDVCAIHDVCAARALALTVATVVPPITTTVARLVTATSAPHVTTTVAISARFVATATLTHLETTVATLFRLWLGPVAGRWTAAGAGAAGP